MRTAFCLLRQAEKCCIMDEEAGSSVVQIVNVLHLPMAHSKWGQIGYPVMLPILFKAVDYPGSYTKGLGL